MYVYVYVIISRCTLRTFWDSNSQKKYGVFPLDSGMSNLCTGDFCTPQTPNQGRAKKLYDSGNLKPISRILVCFEIWALF